MFVSSFFRAATAGFPTLAWGDATAAESYEGMRDYASLKAFADEYVTKPVCSIMNLDVCSDDEKAEIAAVEAQTDAELTAAALKIKESTKAEEKKFEAYLEELQDKYMMEEAKHQAKKVMSPSTKPRNEIERQIGRPRRPVQGHQRA